MSSRNETTYDAIKADVGADTLLDQLFHMESVQDVNHKPHVYMIGSKHIKYAHDHTGGMITEEVCNAVPSYDPTSKGGTRLSNPPVYQKDITYDTVLFIKLKDNVTHSQFKDLAKVLQKYENEKRIDGMIMIETPEEYRVVEDPE